MTNPDDQAFATKNQIYYDVVDLEKEKATLGQFKAPTKVRGGLTKREYFAAMAMQGLISKGGQPTIDGKDMTIPAACILIADTVIAELNKPSKGMEP